MWFAVTRHPTAEWLAQQIKAFPWETAPTYLVRDNDGAYGPIHENSCDERRKLGRPCGPCHRSILARRFFLFVGGKDGDDFGRDTFQSLRRRKPP